jgi:hypothetical protein
MTWVRLNLEDKDHRREPVSLSGGLYLSFHIFFLDKFAPSFQLTGSSPV